MLKRLFGDDPDSSDIQARADAISREEEAARRHRREQDDEWESVFDRDLAQDASDEDHVATVSAFEEDDSSLQSGAPADARLEAVRRAWGRLQPESQQEIAARMNRSESGAQVALADALRSREQVWEAVQTLLGGEGKEAVSMFQVVRDRHLRALVAALLPELAVLQQLEGR